MEGVLKTQLMTSLNLNLDMIQYRSNCTDLFPGELNPTLFDVVEAPEAPEVPPV